MSYKSCKESLKQRLAEVENKVDSSNNNTDTDYCGPPLKCNYCDKTFKFTSEQRRHEQSHYKKFDCKFCQKKFNYLSALRRHEKQHERAGKVPCEECGRSFRDETLLKRHIQYAHKGSFTCPDCQVTYTSKAALTTHSRTHQPSSERRYKCGFEGCNKTFNFPHHLKHHELTHCNSKQHFCSHCGKGFIQLHHLKCHMKSHMADTRITCTEPGCDKKFATESSRKRHQAATHILKSNEEHATKQSQRKNVLEDKYLCTKCGEFISRRDLPMHSLECINKHNSPEHSSPKKVEVGNSNSVNEKEVEEVLEHVEGGNCDISYSAIKDKDFDNNYCKAVIGGCMVNGGGHSTDNCLCTQMSKIDKLYDNDLDIERELLSLNDLNAEQNDDDTNSKTPSEIRENNVSYSVCKGCECSTSKNTKKDNTEKPNVALGNILPNFCPLIDTVPKIECRPDNVIKLVDTFDLNITSFSACYENQCTSESKRNEVTIPMNSCKEIFGNCIVSGNDTMGEGCLCAKMSIESQHAMAQEIEEIAHNNKSDVLICELLYLRK